METVWILGDQLIPDHPAFVGRSKQEIVLLFIESKARGGHLRYHQQKLVLLFSAMRHRAAELREAGWTVDYHELAENFEAALRLHVTKYQPTSLRVMAPNDWAMTKALPALAKKVGVPLEILPSEQFLVRREDFQAWAGARRQLLMENHYRVQRKRLNILIDAHGEPEGGAWNFDEENRLTIKEYTKARVQPPQICPEKPDEITQKVIAMVSREFAEHPGKVDGFWLPVTRARALVWLERFIAERLAYFGPWEDTMVAGEPVLFHSVLSPMLNNGLLTPRECVEAAIAAYRAGEAPLPSVEGFVRQLIGWREFVNGIYWTRMPDYTALNYLEAERSLPAFVYTGKTELNCLRHAFEQVIATGYNHHIQRLMVLGNFFLLGGYHPAQVLRWFNEMYVDAYDWVMAANVIGMILHADGGYMATKPYAAGAGYISKMSNYCAGCRYKPEVKIGPDACPFNYLYWNFYRQHEARFAKNPRVGMMVKMWQKKSPSEQRAIQEQAEGFLAAL